MWNLLIDHGNVPERRLDTEQFLVAAGYRRVQRARGGTQRTALRGLAAFEPMDVESCAVAVSVETFSVCWSNCWALFVSRFWFGQMGCVGMGHFHLGGRDGVLLLVAAACWLLSSVVPLTQRRRDVSPFYRCELRACACMRACGPDAAPSTIQRTVATAYLRRTAEPRSASKRITRTEDDK